MEQELLAAISELIARYSGEVFRGHNTYPWFPNFHLGTHLRQKLRLPHTADLSTARVVDAAVIRLAFHGSTARRKAHTR